MGFSTLPVAGFSASSFCARAEWSGGEEETGGEEEMGEQGRAAREIVLHGGRNIGAGKCGCQWQKGRRTAEGRWSLSSEFRLQAAREFESRL